MIVSKPTISEDELQAYIDNRLEGPRLQAVEQYLAETPEQAEKVRYHQQVNHLLREAYDAQLTEPVPRRLRQFLRERMAPANLAFWQRPLSAAAAAMLLLTTGIVSGWLLHAESFSQQIATVALAKPAFIAHVVYTPEVIHPVEVDAKQDQHLFKWLSNRLGEKVRAPDITGLGYHLVGGRLLPAEKTPAAQFMYENDAGVRITLYIRSGFSETQETAFQYREEAGIGTFYWVDRPFGYALSGALSRAELLKLATTLYAELSLV